MGTYQLTFAMEPQKQTNWCWAAVAISVANFFGTFQANLAPWTQCALANAELGQTTCCTNGSSQNCDQDWTLDTALSRVGHLAGPKTNGPSAPADVEVELAASRPVGVRIGWYGGGKGHFVVISGYDDSSGTPEVDVEDPYWGPSVLLDFNTFSTAYQSGTGQWTHTYPIV
jgi:hypothetical protein